MASQPPPSQSKWSELKAKLAKTWHEVTSPSTRPTVTLQSEGAMDPTVYLCPSCQGPLPPELHRILLTQTTVVCEMCGFEITFSSPP